ncbi:uncharacterized protein BYT42DRAFT_584034 [Radiomyces spectabilis]|uniref:uncharacterized protein n=1 Tax=Radiomyces spectabilis TaxID=64574 RepID=UPI00221FFAAA|nr:uncharacterized protein BYT42DRAFT_584034 [Radiomyces spectabilis]KAI8369342.1 hypothetical protein BYT42DRAFT_584034 [Radiomyces spectabilis]
MLPHRILMLFSLVSLVQTTKEHPSLHTEHTLFDLSSLHAANRASGRDSDQPSGFHGKVCWSSSEHEGKIRVLKC